MSMDAWGSLEYSRDFVPYMQQSGVLVQDCREIPSLRAEVDWQLKSPAYQNFSTKPKATAKTAQKPARRSNADTLTAHPSPTSIPADLLIPDVPTKRAVSKSSQQVIRTPTAQHKPKSNADEEGDTKATKAAKAHAIIVAGLHR